MVVTEGPSADSDKVGTFEVSVVTNSIEAAVVSKEKNK